MGLGCPKIYHETEDTLGVRSILFQNDTRGIFYAEGYH